MKGKLAAHAVCYLQHMTELEIMERKTNMDTSKGQQNSSEVGR